MRDLRGCALLVRRDQRCKADAPAEEAVYRPVHANRRPAIIQRPVAALVRNIQPLRKRPQLVRPAQRHALRHAHGAHPFVPGKRHSHQSGVVLQETCGRSGRCG